MARRTGNTVHDWLQVKRDPKKQIRDRYKRAKDALRARRNNWRKIRRAYHGYVRKTSGRRGRANFHFHKLFPQIELEAARFITTYFQHTPFVAVSPTSGRSVEKAQRHEQVVQHYLEHAPTFFLEICRLVKYSFLFGTGFMIPSWRRDVGKVHRRVPVVLSGQHVGTVDHEVDEVLYEGLWFKTFSPFDVFPAPFSSWIDQAPWVIVVEFVPVGELVKRAEMGVYDKAKVMQVALNCYEQQEWEIRRCHTEMGGSALEHDPELVCLQHMFDGTRITTLANDDQVIRDETGVFWHPWIPMVQGVKTIDPDSLWPIGSGRAILPMQQLVNLYVNAMTDLTVSHLWPIWKYRSSGVNPNDLLSLPNQRIPVKNMDDVDVIRMPEMKHDLLAIKTMLEANIEETTGYFGAQKGFSEQRNTATSDAIFQSEGNTRINSDILTFERQTLIPKAKIVSQVVQQFMPDELEISVSGPGARDFQTVTRDEIRGEFNFQVSGPTEALNRAVVQQQLIELFSKAQGTTQLVQMPNGALVPVPVLDTYNALRDLYEGYNRKNVDKLLYRPEVFGQPLNNDLLSQYGLPAIPGLDQLEVNPRTGARRRSTNPQKVVSNANRVKALELI